MYTKIKAQLARMRVLDLFKLLLGHFSRYRRPELQDITTRGMRESRGQDYVMKVVNVSLLIRKWLTNILYLQPRYLKSYIHFQRNIKPTISPNMKRNTLSLLCPTRDRVGHIDSFIKSVYRTAAWKEQIELLFYVDSDDPRKDEYHAFFAKAPQRFPRLKRCEMVVGEPIGVPRAWNVLASRCQGDLLMMANDDQVYVDYGWDVLLNREVAKFPDTIFCMYFDDGQYAEGTCDFPIIGRHWFETLGYFTPSIFEYWETETWITDIARRINRLHAVPNILVEHLHYQDYKSPFDATYQRHRMTREKSIKDHVLFLRTATEREKEANKLRSAIGLT